MHTPDHQGAIASSDGTRIAWQRFGRGPAVLVANGVGVTWKGLAMQVEHLAQRFSVICWDYRGTFASGRAGPAGLGVEAHARDALAVLDHLGLDRSALLGWSMGVQVVVEVARLAPDRVERIACIGGVPWSPFQAATPIPGLHRVFRRAVRHAAHVAPLASPAVRQVVGRPLFFPLARATGYVRGHADREAFLDMARGVAGHHHPTYLRTLAELGRHDGREALSRLEVPVLFLGGEADRMIRPSQLRRAAELAPDGRVEVVPGCSHFVTVEAPVVVNRVLETFLSGGA